MDNWAILFFTSCAILFVATLLFIKQDARDTRRLEHDFSELKKAMNTYPSGNDIAVTVNNPASEMVEVRVVRTPAKKENEVKAQ